MKTRNQIILALALVLTAIGVPVEGIGLLLSIDWLLDRFRTTVNVWGDTVGAAVVEERLKRSQRSEVGGQRPEIEAGS